MNMDRIENKMGESLNGLIWTSTEPVGGDLYE